MEEGHNKRFGDWRGFKLQTYELCHSCKNANGQPPWANAPNKAYCIAYPKEKGVIKPKDVLNGDCAFYIRT